MNKHAERRRINRFGLLRPALKRRPGRTIEGKYRRGAESRRNGADNPARPAIERIGFAVGGFGRGRKERPVFAPGEPDQNEGANFRANRQISRAGMKRAAPGQPLRGDRDS
jgi:hypothetical protein